MISLGGLGAAPGGYQAAQARMYELQKQQQDQQSMAALAAYAAAQGGQGNPQGPVPGLQGMPQMSAMLPQAPQGPPVGTLQPNQGQFSDFNSGSGGPSPLLAALQARAAQQGGGAPAQPSPQQPPLAKADMLPMQQPPAPASPPSPQVAAGGPAAQPPQQAAQPQQLNLPSPQGIRPGTLDLVSVINAIAKSNPGISPQVLVTAAGKYISLMAPAEAEKWKAIDAQQKQQQMLITAGYTPAEAGINVPGGSSSSGQDVSGINQDSGNAASFDALPANVRSAYTAVIEGRAPLNTFIRGLGGAQSLRGQRALAVLDEQSQAKYGLPFDQGIYTRRQQAEKVVATGGKWSNMLLAGESGVQNLSNAATAFKALHNLGGIPLLNKFGNDLINAVGGMSGGRDALNAFIAAAQTSAQRLASFLANAGAGTVTETEAYKTIFNPNSSPAQMQSALQMLAREVQQQYSNMKSQFAQDAPGLKFKTFSPETEKALNDILGMGANPAVPGTFNGGQGAPAGPQEGDTATGPNGQRLILRNGQWMPLA